MLGLRVALIERGAMGGDCLNVGCVPSKALIAAAQRAHILRSERRLGVGLDGTVQIDYQAIHAHIHRAIVAIAPNDSQARFEQMGCEVFRGQATLEGRAQVRVNGRTLSAPRIVLAVGSRPKLPDLPGLDDVPYLTNETLFDLTSCPQQLVVLGGGPIGMEMAQAYCRLGASVTVVAQEALLEHDDREAVEVAVAALKAEGVRFVCGQPVSAAKTAQGITLRLKAQAEVSGSHLLIATGRRVDVEHLGLAAAGVAHDHRGIVVDSRLRTSNRHIYAIGDCRPGPRFTHLSGYEGSNLVLQIGLGLPVKTDLRTLPRVTYLDPEIAQVGLTEEAARARHGNAISTWKTEFADNDRAIVEDNTHGFVKLIKAGRKLVGATIVGPNAGNLLMPLAMSIAGKSSTLGLAALMAPYPNRIEHVKKAAFESHQHLIFNRFTRSWARLLAAARR
jgi:pyruvate/2-oxoglutarate dehydrogenase complex dihydrolipoamide dehydrogenase (E3) component